MSEREGSRWKNPIAAWEPGTSADEVETPAWRDPGESWQDHRAYKVATAPVGRWRFYHKFAGHGARLWARTRYWPTRRRVLNIRGGYNPKTLRTENEENTPGSIS